MGPLTCGDTQRQEQCGFMTTSRPADPGVNFRLSRDVWPRRYDVRLSLDLDRWRPMWGVAGRQVLVHLRELRAGGLL